MARRCGCGEANCACTVQGDGETIQVTGNGSALSPYVISSLGSDTKVQPLDTPSINMSVTGNGTVGTPYQVSGDVIYSLDGGNTATAGSDGGIFVPPSGSGTGFRAGAGTDSVIGGDLDVAATAAGQGALAVGNGVTATGDDSTGVGHNATPTGPGSVALGYGALASGDSGVATGQDSEAAGNGSTALGRAALASGLHAIALGGLGTDQTGAGTEATADNSIAIGNKASVFDLRGVAVGIQAAAGLDAIGIGNTADAENVGDIAIGRGASTVFDASNGRNVVIGDSASADCLRGIAIGTNAAVNVDDSGVIKTDDLDIQPSSGGARSNAHVRNVGGQKRRLATIIEEVNSNGAAGATETVAEPETATLNFWTLDANCTITFPALGTGKSFTLKLKQDATGSRTVTWPGTVLWAAGVAPTLTTTANKTDIFSFLCDGTNWFGFVAGQNY